VADQFDDDHQDGEAGEKLCSELQPRHAYLDLRWLPPKILLRRRPTGRRSLRIVVLSQDTHFRPGVAEGDTAGHWIGL
jgi:hypothetical protein